MFSLGARSRIFLVDGSLLSTDAREKSVADPCKTSDTISSVRELKLSTAFSLSAPANKDSKLSFQHKKIKFVSPSGHVMFCLLYRY